MGSICMYSKKNSMKSESNSQSENHNKELFLSQKYDTHTYEFNSQLQENIPTINQLYAAKNKKSSFHPSLGIKFYSSLQFKFHQAKMEEQQCIICLDQFETRDYLQELKENSEEDVYTLKCTHKFHEKCLKRLIDDHKNWVKCPVCGTIYGIMMGDMPEGNIEVTLQPNIKCEGYNVGTHKISYFMKSGKRNGQYYPSTDRIAYIPDTEEGRQVVDLLRQCFKRKLTFTVGRSVTTGKDNRIIWNGIHHKTATSGGASHFGYPDPGYLTRVKEELAAKGITSQDLAVKL